MLPAVRGPTRPRTGKLGAVGAWLRCELFPADLDEAVAFYVQVLAFRVARDERAADVPYVALERDGVRLGLAQRSEVPERDQRRPPVGVELVLEVDDLHADHDRVVSAGWPLQEDLSARPWGLSDFRLLDPAGYYWRLTTHSSPQP
jgi:lactoylglutathione lyase